MITTTEEELDELEQEVRELDGQLQDPKDPRPPAMPRADSRDPLQILIEEEKETEMLQQLTLLESLP